MNFLGKALSFLPLIMDLVVVAEKAFADKPKSGNEKKKIVLEAGKAIVNNMAGVSEGGQREFWSENQEDFSNLIDRVARRMT